MSQGLTFPLTRRAASCWDTNKTFTKHVSQGMQREGSIGDTKSTHLFFKYFFLIIFLTFFFPQGPPHWQKLDARQLHVTEETPTGWSKRVETETSRAVMGLRETHSLSCFQPQELTHAAAWWYGANDLSSTLLNTIKKHKKDLSPFLGQVFPVSI